MAEKFHLVFSGDGETVCTLHDHTADKEIVRIALNHPLGPHIAALLLDELEAGSSETYVMPPTTELN